MNSESTIRVLSEHLANQIAAGEVVQRPDSVVKELVENAIDAGAKSVTVVVRDAGKQLIHVIDNGSGMSRDDLAMCVVRHATSKITSEDDLHAIRTLGFRGEAMASIAAVADVEIRTRRASDETGWVLRIRPGMPPDIAALATDVGTQVLVRSLFYNVPARRKFLKSDLTEFRYISDTVQKVALARPDVRVVLYDDKTLVFDHRPSDLAHRAAAVLNVDAQRSLLPIEHEEGGITITGYVGLPTVSRQSRSGQFIFLNERPIQSRSIAHAVASAYEHLIDGGQHPVFVLHLRADPQRVDVNVHPQKHEVKFEDERAVYVACQQAVTKALSRAQVIPSFLGDVPLAHRPLQSLPNATSGGSFVVNRLTGEVLSTSSDISPRVPPASYTPAMQRSFASMFPPREDFAPPTVLQGGSQFLVTTSAEGVVVVDKRAAHERVLYERVLSESSKEPREQSLLFAVTLRLGPSRGAILREYAAELVALGFRLDVESDGTVNVHAVPADVRPGAEDRVLGEIVEELEISGRLPLERRREGIASIYASKQAVRKGDTLSDAEAASLIRDLFACNVPHLAPDGRPSYVVITYEELAQRCV